MLDEVGATEVEVRGSEGEEGVIFGALVDW